MGEFPGSIDCFVDRNRVFINQNDQAAIVIHGTGGSATQTAIQLGQFFATTPAMTCVHYGIDRAGNAAQYCLEQDGAAGNGILDAGYDSFWDQFGGDNINKHTLSVETINDISNSLPLTDPQKQTLFKLVAYWVKKYNIPLSNIKDISR
jgi:N-acetyl-anhydromuramyl-L-alanine amidase AmpD